MDPNQQILDELKKLGEKLDELNTTLVGDAKDQRPGLLERVRVLERWVDAEKKFIYALVFLVVADIVMRLWALVVESPKL